MPYVCPIPDLGHDFEIDHGLICYPTVACYVWTFNDGSTLTEDFPPSSKADKVKSYETKVLDLAAYDRLGQTGFWYSSIHTGANGVVIDGRAAPGA